MNRNKIWIPLIASLGVGAATFYTISKNNEPIGQTLQKVVPVLSNMAGGNDSNTNLLGPHGMS